MTVGGCRFLGFVTFGAKAQLSPQNFHPICGLFFSKPNVKRKNIAIDICVYNWYNCIDKICFILSKNRDIPISARTRHVRVKE